MRLSDEQINRLVPLLRNYDVICSGDTIKDIVDTLEALQRENEELKARVARMREACVKGFSYLSLIFHRAGIRNWDDVGMCSVKDVHLVLNELEKAFKDGIIQERGDNP